MQPRLPQELIVVITRDVVVESASGRLTLRRNDWARVPACGATMRPLRSSAEVMRIAGCWAEITTVSLFQARPDEEVELHYHDGHGYWIFFRGRGRGCSEGVEYGLEPGAMIATAMGHEHALPRTDEIVEAVALETGLYGPKRRGHLHREVHGVPIPAQQ